MPSKISARRQAQKDKRALRKLRDTGLYTGKIDLRKAPTRAAKRALKKFADVLSGKASVLKPADPKSYSKLFTVKGDAVIVPRRKGERLDVDKKTGEIIGTRKVQGRRMRSRLRRVKRGEEMPRPKKGDSQYALPFNRGDHIEWMRHPNYDALKQFMGEYARYKGWHKYSVSERTAIKLEMDFEDDDELTFILEERLGPQHGASGGRYKPKRKRKARKARKARKRSRR